MIDADGLAAQIVVLAGDPLAASDLTATLKNAGIEFGLDQAVFDTVVADLDDENFTLKAMQIAEGKPANHGVDAVVNLKFTPGVKPGILRDDGSLDLLNRGLLTCVEEGDLVAIEVSATLGEPGTQVTGDEIPATPGKEATLGLGDGVVKLDGGRIEAARSGAIQYRPNKQLDVLDHYQHTGDVDIRSGHIETKGSVTITGAVNANFQVKARGDVEIKGAVFGGLVRAKGSVQIGGAISAGESGRVTAGGDLRGHHAQEAKLRCAGAVSLVSDCVGTTVRCRELHVGRRLLGGKISAEILIVASEAGSASGGGTILCVAEPYEEPAKAAVQRKPKANLSRRSATGESKQNSRGIGSKRARAGVAEQREAATLQKTRIEKRAKLLETARIDIEGAVNTGVQLHFGSRRLSIESPREAMRFTFNSKTKTITSTELKE